MEWHTLQKEDYIGQGKEKTMHQDEEIGGRGSLPEDAYNDRGGESGRSHGLLCLGVHVLVALPAPCFSRIGSESLSMDADDTGRAACGSYENVGVDGKTREHVSSLESPATRKLEKRGNRR